MESKPPINGNFELLAGFAVFRDQIRTDQQVLPIAKDRSGDAPAVLYGNNCDE